MGLETPKTFLPILGKNLVLYSLEVFQTIPDISSIVVVSPTKYQSIFPKNVRFAQPGKRRQDSVKNGLTLLPDVEFVMIHDGARPIINGTDVIKLINVGKTAPAAALASPTRNTLKEVSSDNEVISTPIRDDLWEVYTPQMVRVELLKKGFEKAEKEKIDVTDDLSLVELLGIKPTLVQTDLPNIKVTYPKDLTLVEALLRKRL